LGCTFESLSIKKTVVGQFALECLNNNSLHTGYIDYILHKTAIANKLNQAEIRMLAENTNSQQFVQVAFT